MKKLIILLLILSIVPLAFATEYAGELDLNQGEAEYTGNLNSNIIDNNLIGDVKYPNAHSCTSSSQCASNICCSGVCKDSCPQTTEKYSNGKSCTLDSQCLSNNCCSGTCEDACYQSSSKKHKSKSKQTEDEEIDIDDTIEDKIEDTYSTDEQTSSNLERQSISPITGAAIGLGDQELKLIGLGSIVVVLSFAIVVILKKLV